MKESKIVEEKQFLMMMFVMGIHCKCIHTVETGTSVKKFESYRYLPYKLQCKSVDVTINHCKSVFTFFCCPWSSN